MRANKFHGDLPWTKQLVVSMFTVTHAIFSYHLCTSFEKTCDMHEISYHNHGMV